MTSKFQAFILMCMSHVLTPQQRNPSPKEGCGILAKLATSAKNGAFTLSPKRLPDIWIVLAEAGAWGMQRWGVIFRAFVPWSH